MQGQKRSPNAKVAGWTPARATSNSKIDRALIVAPDAAERRELTQLIRSELQAQGRLSAESRSVPVLIERDLGNLRLAANYAPDDRINYRKGSPKEYGIADNSSAIVVAVDARSISLRSKLARVTAFLTIRRCSTNRRTGAPSTRKGGAN